MTPVGIYTSVKATHLSACDNTEPNKFGQLQQITPTSLRLLSGRSQLPSTSSVKFSTSDWYVATRPLTAASKRGSTREGPPSNTCAGSKVFVLAKV
jgi:hypothetical protein